MKKILSAVLVLAVAVALCGCGNMSMGIGNFTFHKIHVDTFHFSGCIEIEEWHDNTTGIEIKTKDGQGIFLSEGTYMMIEDVCPFCD